MDVELKDHLTAGTTTICRCWRVVRKDGTAFGFTDHDEKVVFDGTMFVANGGMTSSAIEKTLGLSSDTAEAVGILSDLALEEQDLMAGAFDGAEVCIWIVNWADTRQRHIIFAGDIGEVSASGGMFRAELRGIEERLDRVVSKKFQRVCPAALGDAACGVDTADPSFGAQATVLVVKGAELTLGGLDAYSEGWFANGRVTQLSGRSATVMADFVEGGVRKLRLWSEFRPAPDVGAVVDVVAGCDKRFETCKSKFHNAVNFRGFPHLPGDDWVMSVPRSGQINDGGSLQ